MSPILLLLATLANGEFLLGRVPPADYDLSDLNGFFGPEDAARACDSHPTCAGFTYRGLLDFASFPENAVYETFFLRYVHQIDVRAPSANWVTYLTEKPFAVYNGTFAGTAVSLKGQTEENVGLCLSNTCSAVSADEQGRLTDKLVSINLGMRSSFTPSSGKKTYVNLNVDPERVRGEESDIDVCCPAPTPTQNYAKLLDEWKNGGVNDTLKRVPCDVDPEVFMREHLLPGIPAMLTGCTRDWPASRLWPTLEALMSRYGRNVTWKADVTLPKGSPVTLDMLGLTEHPYYEDMMEKPVKSYEDVLLSGDELLTLARDFNVTIRVFERVGNAPRRPRFEGTSTDKSDLFADWKWPHAVPQDLYVPSFGGSDYQWVIASQKGTGTHIHQDPVLTDAWNALISGHKV